MPGALDGIRVVELGEGKALAYAGKLLRDLGSEVIKVEPPGGDALRAYGPFPSDEPNPTHSGMFIFLNGGKRGTHLDLETAEGREGLVSLVEGADVLLHSFPPAVATRLGLEREALLERYPRLIVSAVTPYGSTGPYAEWRGYALQAQSGATIARRIGDPQREPLTSPLDQAEIQHGAVHTAVATVLALVHRNRTGRGQFVDVGVMEAVAIAMAGNSIPMMVYGDIQPWTRGSRLFARGPWGVFAARDGDLAVITLLDRQWRTFLEYLGDPEWGNDPRFAKVQGLALRALDEEDRQELHKHLQDCFRERTVADVWEFTQRARISFHPVHTVSQVVESDHMQKRGFFVSAPGPHPPLRVPGAPYRMSVTPWAAPGPPPVLDEQPASGWTSEPVVYPEPRVDAGSLPLEGVRVIDLGQVWAGPLLGRYLADYGTDSIVVDTDSRPRNPVGQVDQSSPLWWEDTFRNRRSVQLDLKTRKGVELFKVLLREADVMIDNYTPRVLPNLGLNYEDLTAEFPRLIIAALSAGGRTGPWSDALSYGPSLTGLYGVKSLNGYPEDGVVMEDASDLDPISGTYGMLAIMAALHHRDRTGEGQMIEIAQGEAGFVAATEAMIEHVWNGREMGPQGNLHRVLAPHGIYPCAGDDRWIAIACGSDDEWSALARAAGHEEWLEQEQFRTAAGRRVARGELDAAIGGWTASKDEMALTQRLQEVGVAAFPAMGLAEMLEDPQFSHRGEHFELPETFPARRLLNGSPWHLSAAPPRVRLRVPDPGQHNEEVFRELLGLSSTEVRALQEEGVIA